MSLTNLADLQSAISDWSGDRTDLSTSRVNDCITLAETDILHGVFDGPVAIVPPLRVRSMETYDSAFALSGEYTNLPTGFLEARWIKLNSSADLPPLAYMTPEAFDAWFTSTDSNPVAYTIVGTQIRVGPGASATDTITWSYWKSFDSLVSASTNWLMTSYPNVYLYGALRHLAFYLGFEERLGTLQTAYVSSIRALIASEKRGQFGGSSLQQRVTGMTIT
jgi:hypothetical protein